MIGTGSTAPVGVAIMVIRPLSAHVTLSTTPVELPSPPTSSLPPSSTHVAAATPNASSSSSHGAPPPCRVAPNTGLGMEGFVALRFIAEQCVVVERGAPSSSLARSNDGDDDDDVLLVHCDPDVIIRSVKLMDPTGLPATGSHHHANAVRHSIKPIRTRRVTRRGASVASSFGGCGGGCAHVDAANIASMKPRSSAAKGRKGGDDDDGLQSSNSRRHLSGAVPLGIGMVEGWEEDRKADQLHSPPLAPTWSATTPLSDGGELWLSFPSGTLLPSGGGDDHDAERRYDSDQGAEDGATAGELVDDRCSPRRRGHRRAWQLSLEFVAPIRTDGTGWFVAAGGGGGTTTIPTSVPSGGVTSTATRKATGSSHSSSASTSSSSTSASLVLATQCEVSHARKVFPCWDHPTLRYVFGLTLVVPHGSSSGGKTHASSSFAAVNGRPILTDQETPETRTCGKSGERPTARDGQSRPASRPGANDPANTNVQTGMMLRPGPNVFQPVGPIPAYVFGVYLASGGSDVHSVTATGAAPPPAPVIVLERSALISAAGRSSGVSLRLRGIKGRASTFALDLALEYLEAACTELLHLFGGVLPSRCRSRRVTTAANAAITGASLSSSWGANEEAASDHPAEERDHDTNPRVMPGDDDNNDDHDAIIPSWTLDLVAVPKLHLGGMENDGIIFIREDVGVWPASSSAKGTDAAAMPGRKAVLAKLIVHEVAHHWLGNAIGLPFAIKEGLCMSIEQHVGASILGLPLPKYAAPGTTTTPDAVAGAMPSAAPTAVVGRELTASTYAHAEAVVGDHIRQLGWRGFECRMAQLTNPRALRWLVSDCLNRAAKHATGSVRESPSRPTTAMNLAAKILIAASSSGHFASRGKQKDSDEAHHGDEERRGGDVRLRDFRRVMQIVMPPPDSTSLPSVPETAATAKKKDGGRKKQDASLEGSQRVVDGDEGGFNSDRATAVHSSSALAGGICCYFEVDESYVDEAMFSVVMRCGIDGADGSSWRRV